MEQDVLTALRQATAERHEELDAHTPLAASSVDLRAYRDHLQLLETWLAPVPAWLDSFSEGEGDGAGLPGDLADFVETIRRDLAHPALPHCRSP